MALSLVASAFSVYYYFVRFVVGPMNVDEVYFAHTTWLVREGYDQYIDFYSNHLPTYFYLLNSVLPHSDPTDLTFIWTVRLSNILIVCGYAFLLTWLNRNKAIFLLPFLLLFVTMGRMTEFRPDTYGLFLFNAAWATLLSGYSRGKLVVASLLAASALLFSARGSIMAVGFAATLAYLLYRHRDARSFMVLSGVAVVLAALALIAYESAPQFASLAVHSAFVDPVRLFAPVSIVDRLFELERLPLVVLTAAALMIAVVSLWREHEPHRSLIVAGASATQLFLIVADPAPYAYVYGWAAVPVVVGLLLTEGVLVRDSRPFLATTALALAAVLAGLIVGYLVVKGHQPRTGSILRAQMDPPISDDMIRRMKTDRLVAMMISGQGQQSLSNQLAVRSEVCRRIDGRVLSVWAYHPICLRDASYYWYEVKWPGIWKDTVPNDKSAFANVFRKTPPSLFIWSGGKSPRSLNEWASGLITGYRKYPQFALRTPPQ